MMRAGDIAIIVLGVSLVVGLWFGFATGDTGWSVQVTRSSGPSFQVPVWTEQHLHIKGPLGETQIEIRNGKARVVASPCTQKLCIRKGWLQEAGQTAACVPNEVAISLVATDHRFDAMNF